MSNSIKTDLTVIVVTYNDRNLVTKCLATVFGNQTNYKFKVIVVDNGSSDGTLELIRSEYPMVEIISNNENLGYPVANNIGIRKANSAYVLLLNPDTELLPITFEHLLRYMEQHLNTGVVGPMLLRPNGQLDRACRRMFPNYIDYWIWILGLRKMFPNHPRVARYNLNNFDINLETEVESVAGAFLLARGKAISEVGLMDERFFIYGEDIDWCYRFVLAKWRVIYLPSITVLHHKGGTSRRYSQKLIYHFYRSNLLLYQKHIAPRTLFLLNFVIYIAILIKFTFSYCLNYLLPKERKRVA